MIYPQDTYLYKGTRVTNTWIKTEVLENYKPITQVYGVIFNQNKEILICRESKDGNWQIPGGHPEKDETIEETLDREVLEEVDVEIENIKVLGIQKVTFPDDLDKDKAIYQVRCIAILKEILAQTPDPATGNTWERRFVSSNKINEYIKWGNVGNAMFKDAIDLRN